MCQFKSVYCNFIMLSYRLNYDLYYKSLYSTRKSNYYVQMLDCDRFSNYSVSEYHRFMVISALCIIFQYFFLAIEMATCEIIYRSIMSMQCI